MYVAPERPDVQYAVQAVKHLCSYLQGTCYDGILLAYSEKGASVLNVNGVGDADDEPQQRHLMEVGCDADHAGHRESRKSLYSVHIYLNGNLMESYVRSQRSIALSSGESEYVSMVGGASEGLFWRHC